MRAHELPELWGGCGGEIVVKEHGGDKDADYAELLGEFFGVIHSSMPAIKWGGSVMTGSYEGAKANGGKPGAYYGTVGIGESRAMIWLWAGLRCTSNISESTIYLARQAWTTCCPRPCRRRRSGRCSTGRRRTPTSFSCAAQQPSWSCLQRISRCEKLC